MAEHGDSVKRTIKTLSFTPLINIFVPQADIYVFIYVGVVIPRGERIVVLYQGLIKSLRVKAKVSESDKDLSVFHLSLV